MKNQVVCVRDVALEVFGRPFFAPTIAAAVRIFRDESKNADSPMSAHPEDFSLWHLGEWEDATGRFVQFDVPLKLVEAAHVQE